MKQIFKIFTFFVLIIAPFFASSTLAAPWSNCYIATEWWSQSIETIMRVLQECSDDTNGITIGDVSGGTSGDDSVVALKNRVSQLAGGFMRYAALFAIAALVIAGGMYVTSLGNSERLQKAKNVALYACLGLVIALVSYTLVNAVLAIIYGSIR